MIRTLRVQSGGSLYLTINGQVVPLGKSSSLCVCGGESQPQVQYLLSPPVFSTFVTAISSCLYYPHWKLPAARTHKFCVFPILKSVHSGISPIYYLCLNAFYLIGFDEVNSQCLHPMYASPVIPHHPSQPKSLEPSLTRLTPLSFHMHIQAIQANSCPCYLRLHSLFTFPVSLPASAPAQSELMTS